MPAVRIAMYGTSQHLKGRSITMTPHIRKPFIIVEDPEEAFQDASSQTEQ